MKISIIITLYNLESYIEEAVRSALNQTYPNTEIIVVNDGSTDNSLDILKTFGNKIKVITQENGGLGKAMNTGIKAASGEMLAFLDGDDIMAPDRLSLQVSEFHKNPELEVTFGRVKQFLSPELEPKKERFRFQEGSLDFKSKISILFKKEVFEKYGLLHEVEMHEFIDWFERAKVKGLNYNNTEHLVAYRRVRENSLSQRADYYPTLLALLRNKINQQKEL